ncbi:MAG: hypothetical protein IJN86_01905 [Clostridia bacterium]|nr:hypothetical protein [Clostridia bacterium]
MTKQQLEDKNKALRAENEEIRAKLDYVVRELEQCNREKAKMATEANDDLYSRAVNTFGETSRLILAIEEMSELTKELSKYIRGRQNVGGICEEMADVEIMLEQLKIVFRNRAAVDYHRSQKLQRLSDKLNGNHDSF